MGFSRVPYTVKTSRGYAVNFSFDFDVEPIGQYIINGYNFNAAKCEINLLQLASVANLPEMRTLLFTQSYTTIQSNYLDGALDIQIPDTYYFQRFGAPPYTVALNGTTNYGPNIGGFVVSACIPIVATQASTLTFYKETNPGSGDIFGKISASLLTYDLAPYVSQGTAFSYQ